MLFNTLSNSIYSKTNIMSTLNHCTGDLSKRKPFALFGPEVTRWTQESLSNLQSTLLQNTQLKFLIETLVKLPSLWPLLKEQYKLSNYAGREGLQQLGDLVSQVMDCIACLEDPGSMGNGLLIYIMG